MKKKKILTISIAAYNVEDCIERCLKSLIIDDDHMAKMEVLIENDGSTDGTAKIAEKFVKKYPDTFKLINKKNGGYGSTVNNSIKLATGKYFKILDGDDEFATDNLPDFIDVLEGIDSDIVSSPCIRRFLQSSEIINENPFLPSVSGERDISILLSSNCNKGYLKMHTVACKTSIFKEHNIKLPEHVLYTDDIAFIMPLLYARTVYVFKKSIYVYNIGREGQSVSLKQLNSHIDDRMTVSKEILGVEGHEFPEVFNNRVGMFCANVIAGHLILCNISSENRRRIIDFDRHVKMVNRDAWENMAEYRTIRLLRMMRFSWISYIMLHFERKIKLRKTN